VKRVHIIATAVLLLLGCKEERARGPLPHEVYVWQRVFTEPLRGTIAKASPRLAGFVALAAEVSFAGGEARVARLPPDPSLRATGRKVGLALRVGPYGGAFAPVADKLVAVAGSILDDARAAGLSLSELQLDFDAGESQLEGARIWVEALRARAAPVPLTFTALPSHLRQPSFRALAEAADGFVLQVHSVPVFTGAPTLCDPAAAKSAVEQAGRLGLPFRVALPTYGVEVGFDAAGKMAGLASEGPRREWPAGVTVRSWRAHPETMAGLVRAWTANRPASLRGILWYRLPSPDDRFAWPWPTLAAVLAGRVPRTKLRAEARPRSPELFDLLVINEGERDLPIPPRWTVRWRGGELAGADGLLGFAARPGPKGLSLHRPAGIPVARVPPGARQAIGWIRLRGGGSVEIALGP
jgi:hypothetical protein